MGYRPGQVQIFVRQQGFEVVITHSENFKRKLKTCGKLTSARHVTPRTRPHVKLKSFNDEGRIASVSDIRLRLIVSYHRHFALRLYKVACKVTVYLLREKHAAAIVKDVPKFISQCRSALGGVRTILDTGDIKEFFLNVNVPVVLAYLKTVFAGDRRWIGVRRKEFLVTRHRREDRDIPRTHALDRRFVVKAQMPSDRYYEGLRICDIPKVFEHMMTYSYARFSNILYPTEAPSVVLRQVRGAAIGSPGSEPVSCIWARLCEQRVEARVQTDKRKLGRYVDDVIAVRTESSTVLPNYSPCELKVVDRGQTRVTFAGSEVATYPTLMATPPIFCDGEHHSNYDGDHHSCCCFFAGIGRSKDTNTHGSRIAANSPFLCPADRTAARRFRNEDFVANVIHSPSMQFLALFMVTF